jgi:hypothetical protein
VLREDKTTKPRKIVYIQRNTMKNKTIVAGLAAVMATGGAAQAQEVIEMTSAFSRNLPILALPASTCRENHHIASDVEFEIT